MQKSFNNLQVPSDEEREEIVSRVSAAFFGYVVWFGLFLLLINLAKVTLRVGPRLFTMPVQARPGQVI